MATEKLASVRHDNTTGMPQPISPTLHLNVNAVEFIPSKILQKAMDKVCENDGNLPRYSVPTMYRVVIENGCQFFYSCPNYYELIQPHVFPYGMVVRDDYPYLNPYPSYYEPIQQHYEDENPQFNDFELSNRYETDFTVDQGDCLQNNSTFVIGGEQYNPYDVWEEMGFMIELYNIPKNYSTHSLLCIYSERPRYIKWCDESHALLVTGSSDEARRALLVCHPIIKSRPMIDASPIAVTTAKKYQLTPAVSRRPWRDFPNRSMTNLPYSIHRRLTQTQNQLRHVFPHGVVVRDDYPYLNPYPSYYEPIQQHYEDENPQLNDFELPNRYETDFTVDQVECLQNNSTFVIGSEQDYNPYEDWEKMGFMIELYNIPKNYSTHSLLCIYTEKPRYIKRCNENHALLVTASNNEARRALAIRHPIIKSRAMVDASPIAVTTAKKCQLTPAVRRPWRYYHNNATENLYNTSQGDAEAVQLDETPVIPIASAWKGLSDEGSENHEDPTFAKGKNEIISCVLNKPPNADLTEDNITALNYWSNFFIEEKSFIEKFLNHFQRKVTLVLATENYEKIQNEMYKQMKSDSNETQKNDNETGPIECTLDTSSNKFGETISVDSNKTFAEGPTLTEPKNKYFEEPKTIATSENYEPSQEIMLQKMEHIIELYNIPKTFKSEDILSVYKEQPCYIIRCDDTHALLVTGSPEQAKRALSINDLVIKSRPMIMGSTVATSVACRYNLAPAMTNKN